VLAEQQGAREDKLNNPEPETGLQEEEEEAQRELEKVE
jgi:hypothetical protein